MCSCGQIFAHPVPEKDDAIGVVYWEIPSASSTESKVQHIQETWNGINPAAKAGGFGALAVLLIVFVIAGSHHPNPSANPRSIAPPMVRPVVPVQSQVPPQASSASAPLVLSSPKEPARKTTGTDTGVHNLNPPVMDKNEANGSGANPTGGQQVEVQQPQQVDITQQVRELNQRGNEAMSDAQPQMTIDVERAQQNINTLQSCIAQLRQIDPDGIHGSLANVFENDLPTMQNQLQTLKKTHEEQKEFGGMNN